MTIGATAKPPVWFWIIATLSTLWSIAGCMAFYTQVTISAVEMAQLAPAQREIWRMMPKFITIDYGVAVGVGLLGSLSLLARSRWAYPLFIISAIAVLTQFGWTFTFTPILTTMPVAKSVPFPVVIIIIALALVFLSANWTKRGWLR